MRTAPVKTFKKIAGNETGSALVIAMLILMLLTIIGIAASRSTDTELQISTNEKWHTIIFYGADGGSETGIELLEQNISSAGFDDSGDGNFIRGNIAGPSLNFYMNATPPDLVPGDPNRDAFMPVVYPPNAPHTNLRIGGNPSLSTGSAIQMAAGYEGKGKGAANGGAFIVYDVCAQRIDRIDSEGAVGVRWRHLY
ncbi:MAG: hypothetical protein GY737_11610 [Desulfobacteraceae bacterium]|nr:hypothetical protein [Desulfobacteraceae bacterium]